jgi:hypothetical protein
MRIGADSERMQGYDSNRASVRDFAAAGDQFG